MRPQVPVPLFRKSAQGTGAAAGKKKGDRSPAASLRLGRLGTVPIARLRKKMSRPQGRPYEPQASSLKPHAYFCAAAKSSSAFFCCAAETSGFGVASPGSSPMIQRTPPSSDCLVGRIVPDRFVMAQAHVHHAAVAVVFHPGDRHMVGLFSCSLVHVQAHQHAHLSRAASA